jgi:YVTN family beta-propeller protein
MLGIMILTLVVPSLSNNVFAQPLHNRTLYEVVKQTSGLNENSRVVVGDDPVAVGIHSSLDTIYVVNSGSNSVSVISALNDTKIKDIAVGERPVAVGIDETTNKVYVVNAFSNNVSVISAENNTKIGEDIPVGDGPVAVGVSPATNKLYVVNSGSNSVSVISALNDTKIKDIAVGERPVAVGIHPYRTNPVYVVNEGNNSVSVISALNDTKIKDIAVGERPVAVGFNPSFQSLDTIYVVNSGPALINSSDTVSVISAENNTKIGEDIPVGDGPAAVGVSGGKVFIVNRGAANSLSVISGENNTKIGEDIPVGDFPAAIGIDETTNTVYVVNSGSNSVSVISALNDTKIKDIAVGEGPRGIGVNERTNTVYVVNSGSDSVSVIDGVANEVVAGVTFQVNPFNSGVILCDGLTIPSPVGQYIYVYSGTECIAKPNEGFEFVSWEQNNLDGNSTQPISVSRPAPILDSIANFMDPDPIAERWDSLFKSWGIQPISETLGLNPYDSKAATLNVTKFGTFIANFKELPPPLPPEFWAQMYAVIATVITALFIPSIVGWVKSKREAKKLKYFHRQIATLNGEGKLDENHIRKLDVLRGEIADAYSKGELNEKHYERLQGEISTLYEEIFRRKISTLFYINSGSVVKKPIQQQLAQIRNEVELSFSKGKLTEKHYDLLNKAISKLDSKDGNNSS